MTNPNVPERSSASSTVPTFSVGQRVKWPWQTGGSTIGTVVACPESAIGAERNGRTPVVYDGDSHVSLSVTERLTPYEVHVAEDTYPVSEPKAVTTEADPRLSQPGTVEYYEALLEQRDGQIKRLCAENEMLRRNIETANETIERSRG